MKMKDATFAVCAGLALSAVAIGAMMGGAVVSRSAAEIFSATPRAVAAAGSVAVNGGIPAMHPDCGVSHGFHSARLQARALFTPMTQEDISVYACHLAELDAEHGALAWLRLPASQTQPWVAGQE